MQRKSKGKPTAGRALHQRGAGETVEGILISDYIMRDMGKAEDRALLADGPREASKVIPAGVSSGEQEAWWPAEGEMSAGRRGRRTLPRGRNGP